MNRKLAFFSLVTIFVLTVSLFAPAVARAEGEEPPAPAESEPAPETVEPAVETGEPVSVPEDEAGETGEPDPEPEPDLILLDSDEPVLIVSEEAADILANSDPVWCPVGENPGTDLDLVTPGNQNNCTTNQASVSDLITYLLDPDSDPGTPTPFTGDGTIYFQDGTYGGTEPVITFDSAVLDSLAALGLEGGWDLTAYSKVTNGVTVFNAPMYLDWEYAVEVYDIAIAAVYDGYSLTIISQGDVSLDNIDVIDNDDGSGAYIDTCVLTDINPDPEITEWACLGNGDVTITGSTFDNNGGDGLWVESGGTIEIHSISATDNGWYGAGLDTYGIGDVIVTDSAFVDNGSTGLAAWTSGAITIDHIMVELNQDGAYLDAGDDISITASYFSENDYGGLWAGTGYGNISLVDVSAVDNMLYGAVVGTDEGHIQVTNGVYIFTNTTDPELYGYGVGLEAGTLLGNVTLSNVFAIGNDIGARVGSAEGDVLIDGGHFMDNDLLGLEAGTGSGVLALLDVYAGSTLSGMQEIGAHLGNLDGPIIIIGGSFSSNEAKGLYIESTGGPTNPVTLVTVEAIDNGSKGAYITYYAPCGTTTGGVMVEVIGGIYQTNGAYGIYAMAGPEGDLILDAITPPDFGSDVDTWNGNPPDSLYGYFLNTDVVPCPPPCEPEEPKPEPKPYNIVEVPAAGGMPVEQNCADYGGTILVLPTDDRAILSCPATGTFEVKELAESELPGDLPGGPTFVAAMEVTLLDAEGNPIPVITNGGTITVAFKIPEDSRPNERFAILYWDPAANDGAGDWFELPEYREVIPGISTVFPLHADADPDDMMRILAGTRSLGGYVKAEVNFPGVFVLIKR